MNGKVKLVTAFAVGCLFAAPFTVPKIWDNAANSLTAGAWWIGDLFNWDPYGDCKQTTIDTYNYTGRECTKVNYTAYGHKRGTVVRASYNCHPGAAKRGCPYCMHQLNRRKSDSKSARRDHYVWIERNDGRTYSTRAICGEKAALKISAKYTTKASKFKVWWGYDAADWWTLDGSGDRGRDYAYESEKVKLSSLDWF